MEKPGPEEGKIDKRSPFDIYPGLVARQSRLLEEMHRSSGFFDRGLACVGYAGSRPATATDHMGFFILPQRSTYLVHGFLALIDSWNVQGAVCLLRSQLDDLLVCGYLRQAPDPESFCKAVMEGRRVDELPDQLDEKARHLNWKKLRDYVKKVAPELDKRVEPEREPWIDEMYSRASGFVHFSGESLFDALTFHSGGRKFLASFGTPQYRPNFKNPSEDALAEWILGMAFTTKVLNDLLDGFCEQRSHPQ